MNPSPVTKKNIILAIFFSLTIIFLITIFQINDRRTKIVFCDVGQGDAAYIRIKNQVDVLVDAGPDRKVLSCLGKYMPFWDRKIELGILSHPNNDHYGGFPYIVERYKLDRFMTVKTSFTTKSYQQLINKIVKKNIVVEYKIQGDIITFRRGFARKTPTISFYWPPADFKSYEDNDYSLVFLFQEGEFRALFTGDASPKVLNEIASSSTTSPPRNDIKTNILKIPHHGSKNGLTKKFLQLADPDIGVISVGKNNPYGHPAKKVLELLEAYKVKIKRTDEDGDIVFNLKE